MSKPHEDETGVLFTLGLMGAFALIMLIVILGSLWPKVHAFFAYLS